MGTDKMEMTKVLSEGATEEFLLYARWLWPGAPFTEHPSHDSHAEHTQG